MRRRARAVVAAAAASLAIASPGAGLWGLGAGALGAASLAGCGGAEPAAKAPQPRGPEWQDVFDRTPELYLVLRPQKMKRDPVYGAFFKALLRVAEARTEMGGVTTLQAADGADEVIVGVTRHAERRGDDVALVLRGVPAELDPEKMTDPTGRPLFHLRDARAKVHELESLDRKTGETSSLFVLPDRTWVVTLGAARDRAREAFAAPFGRPAPEVDPDALAAVRLDAATFLSRFERSEALGVIVKKLRSATLALRPGKEGLAVDLQYVDEDAAAWAEMQTKRLVDDVARAAAARPPEAEPDQRRGRSRRGAVTLELLKAAKVSRVNHTVTIRMDVPKRLLEALPNAGPGDLSL
jgi:hypothetical protein